MEKVTFLESIIKILNLIASVPFFIEILILTGLLLIIMIFFYFRKSKKGKITALIIYCVTLLLLPVSHFSFFVDTLDQIVENYLEIVYFPSCYVYIGMILVTDISIFIDIAKNVKAKKSNWYQALNILYFFVFQFLFFLILRTVISNDIDIFERSSIYSNADLTSLIQISSYLFWIRIGIKLVVFIINRLSRFTFEKKKTNIESPNNNLSLSTENINEKNIVLEDSVTPILNSDVDTGDNAAYEEEANNPVGALDSSDNLVKTSDYLDENTKSFNNKEELEEPLYNTPYLNSDIKTLNMNNSTDSVEKNFSKESSYKYDINTNNVNAYNSYIPTYERREDPTDSYLNNDIIYPKVTKIDESLNIPHLDNSVEVLNMNNSTDSVEKEFSDADAIPILDIDDSENNTQVIQDNKISNLISTIPQETSDLIIKEDDDIDNYFDDFYEQ